MSEENDFELMTPDELTTEIQKIETDPYLLTARPEGRPANIQYHQSIVDKRDALYKAKYPEPERKLVDGVDVTPVGPKYSREQVRAFGDALDEKKDKSKAAQEKLRAELVAEVAVLEQINPDTDYRNKTFDDDVTPAKIEGYRCLRLLNEGNLKDLSPLMIKTAEAAVKQLGGADFQLGQTRVNQLRGFLETANLNSEDDCAFLAGIVNFIYEQRTGEQNGN